MLTCNPLLRQCCLGWAHSIAPTNEFPGFIWWWITIKGTDILKSLFLVTLAFQQRIKTADLIQLCPPFCLCSVWSASFFSTLDHLCCRATVLCLAPSWSQICVGSQNPELSRVTISRGRWACRLWIVICFFPCVHRSLSQEALRGLQLASPFSLQVVILNYSIKNLLWNPILERICCVPLPRVDVCKVSQESPVKPGLL